ncbi:MAG TPA: AAA domain-containing protein, partial [Candidatus Omnitrophota bacterium]|nr:AAA domain-containing protein [Candidatus Omnitrophota bacterium]
MIDLEKHFKTLACLLNLEEKEEQEEFRSEFQNKSPSEREEAGRALLRLNLVDTHFNPAGHRLLTFRYADSRPLPIYSLDTGDVVTLREDPFLEHDKQTGGIVYEKEEKEITVAFSRELPEWLDERKLYSLNLSRNQTTYRRMSETLDRVLLAENSRLAYLRNVLLGIRKPLLGDPVKTDALTFFNPSLNDSQKKAVITALEAMDVALIHGPPGTGKTTVLVEVVLQGLSRRKKILVSAPSNAACDHLVACLARSGAPVLRMGHPARMAKHLREYSLDFKLARHPYAKMIDELEFRLSECSKKRERHRTRRVLGREARDQMYEEVRDLRKEVRTLKNEIFSQVWNESDVVIATHTSAGDPMLERKGFDWVILDEATQAIEPNSWIPILRAGEKIIFAGDHCQLPATVRSREAETGGLGISLFERLEESLGAESKAMLTVQYRMHEHIMNFSSRKFYGGKLIADLSVKTHVLSDLSGISRCPATEKPLLFLDTAGKGFEEKVETGSESRYNPDEARLVFGEFKEFLRAGVPPREVAVISPYRAQVKLIADLLQCPEAEIDSVDAFQGREKEAVILSLVRSNLEGEMGFLTDIRRMNVAITRARRRLTVIGDSATLSAIPFYREFIQYAESVGGY